MFPNARHGDKLINKLLQEAVEQATTVVKWPDTYINARTGRPYKPHSKEEEELLYSDTPRFVLAKGGEGCIAAETLINDVPVAEWQGGQVSTLYGLENASQSYLKGQSNLYLVETENKKKCTVTSGHKFLTLYGWSPLEIVKPGDLIYTTEGFSRIDNIQFVRYGDYYDLTVPLAEHYEAQGIYHHNSGKSVFLVIKAMNRLRRGMDGICLSPNLPSFKRSLFPTILDFLPRQVVIEEHQRYFHPSWTPHTSFYIVVKNEVGGFSKLLCAGGASPLLLEGININFAAIDELRGFDDPEIIKVLTGRIRLPGPNPEKCPPQMFVASTPNMGFMFSFFGPSLPEDEEDEYREFKRQSKVITLRTEDNLENIDPDYIEGRGASLTEAQKRVRLFGEWEDENNPEQFVDITMWDSLRANIPAVRPKASPDKDYSDVLVMSIDAAYARDTFSITTCSRSMFNRNDVAVRSCKVWQPKGDRKVDFAEVERYIRDYCVRFSVVTIVYDVFQLFDMMQRLSKDGVAWCQSFSQTKSRSLSDSLLYDLILQRRIIHDGDTTLRQHLKNADTKTDDVTSKRRLVKRSDSLKIDAAVSLSMCAFECLRLNLG